jgi:hypothetical protein
MLHRIVGGECRWFDPFSVKVGSMMNRVWANLILCVPWLFGAELNSAEDTQRDEATAVYAEAAALARQLGDERFATRESATARLIQLGRSAKPALEEGRTDADREIRYRCARILSIIEELDFQRRLAAFAAGRTDGESDLPGWKRYRSAYGDDAEARALFVEMQKSEPELMLAVEEGLHAVTKTVDFRCIQLQQSQRSGGQALNLGSIAALLFAVDDEQVTLNFQSVAALCSFCYQPTLANAIEDAAKRRMLRKMLGAWIKRGDGWTGYQCLSLAMRYDLKEGLAPAVKVLQNAADQPYIRQNAILAVAKLGDESHLPLIEALLEDKSKCATQRMNNVTFETQLRDVALAAMLVMKKLDPKEFGFDRLELNATSIFVTSTVGFEHEDKRNLAFAKWNKFRSGEKKSTAK